MTRLTFDGNGRVSHVYFHTPGDSRNDVPLNTRKIWGLRLEHDWWGLVLSSANILQLFRVCGELRYLITTQTLRMASRRPQVRPLDTSYLQACKAAIGNADLHQNSERCRPFADAITSTMIIPLPLAWLRT